MTRRQFGLTAGAVPLAAASEARPPRDLLAKACSPDRIQQHLLPRDRWQPFPSLATLPIEGRQSYIAAGEKHLHTAWPPLPATLFLGFARTGNRSEYERESFGRRDRLRALMLAEAAEGKGRFLDEVLNGVWAICEETYWGVPAHVGRQKAGMGLPDVSEPTMDLFAGETGALLAWTIYYLGAALDKLSPLVRERVHLEVDRRILTRCLSVGEHWMTLGMNWNPWCNSNWMTCNLLLERDEKRRREALAKSALSVDHFLNAYGDDGGCDEGPGYWGRAGGALFDWLEIVHSATRGAISIYDQPLVGEIGRYIYRAHIAGDWFTNFADASAKPRPNGALIYRYGRRVSDDKMASFGAWLMARQGVTHGDLWLQFNGGDVWRNTKPAAPLVRDVWLKDIQVMTARQNEGNEDGFYLAAQAGHNAEAHNHNDVGNFLVFWNGQPVLIDVGVETYTRKTFSSERYTIWTMQSAFHNLPTIGGVMQQQGRSFEAAEVTHRSDDAGSELSLNIAKAYPTEVGIKTWLRTLRLDRRTRRVEVHDRYALSKAAPEITFSLMTPCRVTAASSVLRFETGKGILELSSDGPPLAPAIEEIAIADPRLRGVWGERLYRVVMKCQQPPLQGEWRMSVRGA
jgi:hypothetical protein